MAAGFPVGWLVGRGEQEGEGEEGRGIGWAISQAAGTATQSRGMITTHLEKSLRLKSSSCETELDHFDLALQ